MSKKKGKTAYDYEDNDFYAEDTDYDDDYSFPENYNPPIEPIPPIKVYELSGSRKNRELASITMKIVERYTLKVMSGIVYCYDEHSGCFGKLDDLTAFIVGALDEGTRDELSSKDFKEIAERILHAPELQSTADGFNMNPNLINCENGVVDISGEKICLLNHSPHWMFTYSIKANYQENICCANAFSAYCQTSLNNDPDKMRLLLEMMGYVMSDSIAGKCALFFIGAPNSGKSIVSEFLTKMLGDEITANIPLHQLASRFNKAELFGKKANIAGEIKVSKITDISTFKMVTGGDRIQGEFKGKDPFYFLFRGKLVFSGNGLLGTNESDTTAAFSNRLIVLMFNQSIPKEDQDTALLDKLTNEKDAIFTMVMEALIHLKQRNFSFQMPPDSLEFIDNFTKGENTVKTFIEDNCTLGEECRCFNASLYEAYTEFCKLNGFEPSGKSVFYMRLDSVSGIKPARIRMNGENRHGRIGIKINTSAGGTLEQKPVESQL